MRFLLEEAGVALDEETFLALPLEGVLCRVLLAAPLVALGVDPLCPRLGLTLDAVELLLLGLDAAIELVA